MKQRKKRTIRNLSTISDIFTQAWQKVPGMKASFWGAGIIAAIVAIITHFIELGIRFTGSTQISAAQYHALQKTPTVIVQTLGHSYYSLNSGMVMLGLIVSLLIGIIIQFPIKAGIILIGLRRAANKSISFKFIFQFYKRDYLIRFAGFIISIALVYLLFVFVGALLFAAAEHLGNGIITLIAGLFIAAGVIYFVVGIYMALPIMIDRKAGPLEAINLSCNTINPHWFKVFAIFLLSLIIVVISAIPLGIGLIWSLPWAVTVNGILYQQLFGIAGKDPVSKTEHQ